MGRTRHILALVQPGTNSRDIFLDALTGFEEAGHRVTRLDLGALWQATGRFDGDAVRQGQLKGDLTQLVIDITRANRVDVAVGMWGNVPLTLTNPLVEGRAGTVFDMLGVPLVWWWLDAPHWAHAGAFVQHLRTDIVRGRSSHHIVNNVGTAREMRECFGMGRVHAIGYGVDVQTFAARGEDAGARPTHDVVMCIGPGDPAPSAVLSKMLESEEVDWHRVRAGLAKELEGQVLAGFAGDATVRDLIVELLRGQVSRRHEPVLGRMEELAAGSERLRHGLEVLVRSPALYVKVTDLVRSVERYERGGHAATLARRFSLAAFGAGVGAWAAGWGVADRLTDLGTVEKDAQGAAYRRGRVAVNVMRWQDDVGINIKPMEIAASGVACVCGNRAGLSEAFAIGEEVMAGDSPAEVVGAVESLLAFEGKRARLARAGEARTQRDHTWKAKSAEWMKAVFGAE